MICLCCQVKLRIERKKKNTEKPGSWKKKKKLPFIYIVVPNYI